MQNNAEAAMFSAKDFECDSWNRKKEISRRELQRIQKSEIKTQNSENTEFRIAKSSEKRVRNRDL